MKVEQISKPEGFKPIVVAITIETQAEADRLLEVFGSLSPASFAAACLGETRDYTYTQLAYTVGSEIFHILDATKE